MGSLVYTPGAILDAADALNSDFERTATDVETSDVDGAFKSDWRVFADSWGAFYKSLRGVGGYIDRLWGATMEQVDTFRSDLRAWQARFKAAGGQLAGPDTAPPTASGLDFLGDMKWILLIVLGVVVAANVLPVVLPKIKR